jgi:hypothetical protein
MREFSVGRFEERSGLSTFNIFKATQWKVFGIIEDDWKRSKIQKNFGLVTGSQPIFFERPGLSLGVTN